MTISLEIKRNINYKEICKKLVNKDLTSLSKAITLIESNNKNDRLLANKILSELQNKNEKNTLRIGVTGVPGAGKSTFIENFGSNLTDLGKKVAVLTIDPSSTISRGSILGDKTRMEKLSQNKNVFIRPTAASNFQGGVAKNTRESIFLCESAGYDIIIVETVGVGQNEISVSEMVDFFLLLKIAGSGDELQGIKRGIIEMSDLIAINKCDGENIENSEKSKNEFQLALKLFPKKNSEWIPKVLTCSSVNGKGLEEIWKNIKSYQELTKKNNYFFENRINQNKFWLRQIINESIQRNFYENSTVKKELQKQLKKLEKCETSVFEATQAILASQ
ncbi:MAG: methylmalonyl Co-A mutase-associated GTPase MeaB [Flavobacteriaceae bacterium]|nr:methylmalonyl Co-A mutase-associated GTPase MeaB [Flavobacteriaceae bacterium]